MIKRLLYTLIYLTPTQLLYQIYYRLRPAVKETKINSVELNSTWINAENFLKNENSYSVTNNFNFLNINHDFGDEIDWNIQTYGKLWCYNLNYFEYLNQRNITASDGLKLIKEFTAKSNEIKDGFEPYPTSLRIINWVKFLSANKLEDKSIDYRLYQDTIRLTKSTELHLLANHYLENGFGLLFSAYYFKNDNFYKKAYRIIELQLKEQLLADGAHYELSPMYHQIILVRVLDGYNLVKNNDWKNDNLKEILLNAAQKMLSWLDRITFRNGEIPMVNDASPGIAPDSISLMNYAESLLIKKDSIKLKESGYRMFKNDDFELFCDVGQLAPNYQPGHSHADSLQFLLNYKNLQYLCDTGISTYEKNQRRLCERSTASHNTLTVNELNSSDVWSGFRVGKRAKTVVTKESENSVSAFHKGYAQFNIIHHRTFNLTEERVEIKDSLQGDLSKNIVKGFLHFHHDRNVELFDDKILIDDELRIRWKGIENLQLLEYELAKGFNTIKKAQKICYRVTEPDSYLIFEPNQKPL